MSENIKEKHERYYQLDSRNSWDFSTSFIFKQELKIENEKEK